jgi:hypothetical protein
MGDGGLWRPLTRRSRRLFGEHSLARSFENIARELAGKVSLYNMLVNM